MRNPRQRRSIAAALAAASAATIVALFVVFDVNPSKPIAFYVLIAAFFATLIACALLIAYHVNVLRQNSLLSGKDRLAQWTISPTDWEQFERDEAVRKGVRENNSIKARHEHPGEAIPVIIARRSLQVGSNFEQLTYMRGLTWIPDPLPCLEFNMRTPTKSGTVNWAIRFPVNRNDESLARTVWDHFQEP